MHELNECPVCTLAEGQSFPVSIDIRDTFHVKCERCGPFSIARTAVITRSEKIKKPILSAWIRQKAIEGVSPPEFDSKSLDLVLKNLPKYSPVEKQALLLRGIMKNTQHPGSKVSVFSEIDFPLAWAENKDELNYYIKALQERGLIGINTEGLSDNVIDEFPFEVWITPAGWEYLEKHDLQPLLPDQVFIAMSFSKEMDNAWKLGIAQAISDAGYRPYRVDEKPHNEWIDAKIITEIKNSRFIVADTTEQKPGVYYEAGFAQGLNKQVLWCVREDDLKNVHFDTRQIAHVVWKDIDDLRDQLYEMICAVVGKNPKRQETGTD